MHPMIIFLLIPRVESYPDVLSAIPAYIWPHCLQNILFAALPVAPWSLAFRSNNVWLICRCTMNHTLDVCYHDVQYPICPIWNMHKVFVFFGLYLDILSSYIACFICYIYSFWYIRIYVISLIRNIFLGWSSATETAVKWSWRLSIIMTS